MFEGVGIPAFPTDDSAEEERQRRIKEAKGEIQGPWWWCEARGDWYFHSFYPHQPDVNYDNPRVLCDDLRVLTHWIDSKWIDSSGSPDGQRLVSYVRLDAIPFVFKRGRKDVLPAIRNEFPEIERVHDLYTGNGKFPQGIEWCIKRTLHALHAPC
jgi:maltose alpha-D-glucosyltransferase/alpha-amylase